MEKNFILRCILLVQVLVLAIFTASCGGSAGYEAPPPPDDDLVRCPETGLPQLVINTDDPGAIINKEDYLRATLNVSCATDPADDLDLDFRIRGRGNSTWDMSKKPYKLKLDNKESLLGMTSGKNWALLANYADKTMLRNEIAFHIARVLEMPYTPQSRFVEVTLNGRYDGVYQLTNKVYEVTDQVKADAKTQPSEWELAEGFSDVFLLEIDFRLNLEEEQGFVSNSGISYLFKSDTDENQVLRVAERMNWLESIIADRTNSERLDIVEKYIDLDSLINLYLVNELSNNVDAFVSSTYLYRLRDGRLTFGPVWDFDLAFGNAYYADSQYTSGWYVRDKPWNSILRYLVEDEAFANRVRERWQYLVQRVPEILQFSVHQAMYLDAAQKENFDRWPILDVCIWPNPRIFGSYQAEVSSIISWLGDRAKWITDNQAGWNIDMHTQALRSVNYIKNSDMPYICEEWNF